MKITELTEKLDEFFKKNPPNNKNLHIYYFLNGESKKPSPSERVFPITLENLLEKMSETNSEVMKESEGSNKEFFSEMEKLLTKAKAQMQTQKEDVKIIDDLLKRDEWYQNYQALGERERHAMALPSKYLELLPLKDRLENSFVDEDYLSVIKKYKEKAVIKKYKEKEDVKKQKAAQLKAVEKIDDFLKNDKWYQKYQTLGKREQHAMALPKKYFELMSLKTKLTTSLMKEEDYLPQIKKYTTTEEEKKGNAWDDDLKKLANKYNFDPSKTPSKEIATILSSDIRFNKDVIDFCEKHKDYLVSLALTDIDSAKKILPSKSLTMSFSEKDLSDIINKYWKDIKNNADARVPKKDKGNYEIVTKANAEELSPFVNKNTAPKLEQAIPHRDYQDALKKVTEKIEKAQPQPELHPQPEQRKQGEEEKERPQEKKPSPAQLFHHQQAPQDKTKPLQQPVEGKKPTTPYKKQ